MKYTVIVNVNLEYAFDAKNAEDAIIEAENVELPKEYVTGSFEIVKMLDENENTVDY